MSEGSYKDGHDEPTLPIPPPCFGDPDAIEALRLWKAADGKPSYTLRFATWESPYQWGIVFADVIRYIAQSAEKQGLHREPEDGGPVEKVTKQQIMETIMQGLINELDLETDVPKDWEPDA